MKGVQCYEIFGGIEIKITHFYFISFGFIYAFGTVPRLSSELA